MLRRMTTHPVIRFVRELDDIAVTIARNTLVQFCALLAIFTMIVGGALFSVFEADADLFDGIYWTWVVMPTVGFGDFSPETMPGRLLYGWVVGVGWIGTLLVGGVVAGVTLDRLRTAKHSDTLELGDDILMLESILDHIERVVTHPDVEREIVRVETERHRNESGRTRGE